MRPLVKEFSTPHTPDSLAALLAHSTVGVVLLRSAQLDSFGSRYSFLTANPFLTFRSFGSRGETRSATQTQIQYGNPWKLLDSLMSRFELLDELDLPFPLGGCFGYWGYDLKNFVEPKLCRRALNDLELPDCCIGFYDSLVVFDHHLGKAWIVSTGLDADGSRGEKRAQHRLRFWEALAEPDGMERGLHTPSVSSRSASHNQDGTNYSVGALKRRERRAPFPSTIVSNFAPAEFISRIERSQAYIRRGDIYQVNLAQRLALSLPCSPWNLFQRLTAVSPAPFSSYINCGDFQIASASPELFLRLSGSQIQTRPIKGTRPRSTDATRDTQLAYELQTSPKELAELVMITDLLRNDLGKVCEFGSVHVPELVRLERFSHVQHLVSTVEGRLRPGVTHFDAFASCFPGGSVTGAPKIRAMEIIDELEPITRGPYTGAIGYIGFNRESQLSITIRAAICKDDRAWLHVGAGIVADSIPEAEYDETLAKAQGFLRALELSRVLVS